MKGESGLSGLDGLAGPKGERGDTGEPGLPGLAGPLGPQVVSMNFFTIDYICIRTYICISLHIPNIIFN